MALTLIRKCILALTEDRVKYFCVKVIYQIKIFAFQLSGLTAIHKTKDKFLLLHRLLGTFLDRFIANSIRLYFFHTAHQHYLELLAQYLFEQQSSDHCTQIAALLSCLIFLLCRVDGRKIFQYGLHKTFCQHIFKYLC